MRPTSARAPRRPAPRARLGLESLEDRCLLSGGITLTPSEPAPQLVGEPITWTATVPKAPPGLIYQFSVGSPGGPFHVMRDFSPDNHFTWAPMQEGNYRIRVTVKDGFDAEDTRRASDPTAHSRGQVWKINEQTMTATLVFNADLGNYSDALGAAQRPSNGDYSFDSGRQGQAPNQIAQTIEVRPDGSKAYVLQLNKTEYRSFRIQTLYEGISDQLAGGSEETSHHGDDSRDRAGRDRHRGDGPPGASAPAQDAELGAHHGIGAGVSLAATGSLSDDYRPPVAAALTASSRLLAPPSTPTALIPENVQRLDQLFAAGLEDGTSLVLLRAKHHLLNFGDENGEDTVL